MTINTFAVVLLLIIQAGNGVDFRANKEIHAPSERICFMFVNQTPKLVKLPNPNPWTVVDEKGEIIFSPMSAQVIENVHPAGMKQWCWDQRRTDGSFAGPGRYIIKMIAYVNGEKKVFQEEIVITATDSAEHR